MGAPRAIGFRCERNRITERSTLVNDIKYIGMDVHQGSIVIAVLDGFGKLVMESIIETPKPDHSAVHPRIARNAAGDLLISGFDAMRQTNSSSCAGAVL